MADPFRSDLDAAHQRIDRLEAELREARGDGEPPRRGAIKLTFGVVLGLAFGVLFMMGAVRSRGRALSECSADLEHERTARVVAETQLRVTMKSPPTMSLRDERTAAIQIDCATPYWFDAQGVKHYKPECIR